MVVTAILLGFFAAFSGVATSYITRFSKELSEDSQARLAEVASYISAHMTTIVSDTQESLKSISSAVALIDDPKIQMDYLKNMAEQYSFSYIGCASSNGQLYATVPSESVDISNETYFIDAMRGESTVSNLERKIFNDHALSGILLSVPMGRGSVKGVLVAMLDISQLSSTLKVDSFDGEGYSYIFDKRGTIIMRTKSLDFNNLFKTWELLDYEKNYSYQKFYDDVMANKEGLTCFNNLGVKKFAYYYPLPFNDWTIVNIVPQVSVSAKADKLTHELILVEIVLVLSFLVLMYLTMRSYRSSQNAKQETNAKSAFLANMSHEIRTPMNAIVGISEILLRDDLSAEQRSKVQSILSSGKGLLTIINDILDLSKIESGKFSITDEVYEIESLLYDLTVIAAIRIGEKPLEFFVELDPLLPRKLIGDMGRIKQVLLNIVGNAIKFTDQGSVRLIINAQQDKDEWILQIEVRDTGIGIKPEDLSKLFINFNQVDTNRNRDIEGTGLGLAISQKLCKMMSGNITVTSEYGKGSSFVVTVKQANVIESLPICHLNDNFSILVCEPSQILREYECSCMDKLNLKYDMCVTYDEFNNKLNSNNYTHVIAHKNILDQLDIYNPDMSTRTLVLFILKEYSLIGVGAGSNNIYIPLFPLGLISALNNVNDTRTPRSMGVIVSEIKPLPFVRILIVDDNPVNIQVAKGLMAPYFMHIDHVCSGDDAILAVQNKSYDLVLMDHMMPVMSGVEALKRIRALPSDAYKNLPIVALTANATSDARQLFLKEGFDDFLSKPIETQWLDSVLRKYLKQINATRAKERPAISTTREADIDAMPILDNVVSVEVDFHSGLENVGSISTYIKILESYLDSTKDRLPKLTEYYQSDKERFIIEIHGLKSACAAIGAGKLSSIASDMEQQGRSGQFEDIESNLLSFLQQSNAAIDEIETFITQAKNIITSTSVSNSVAVTATLNIQKHIVIVDDNPVNLDFAESVLSDEYQLTKLSSGKQLLQFLLKSIPDMILLDINMPEMDGYETLRAVRQNDAWVNIPVIFLTGQNDIQSERESFRLGAKDFIVKPFDNIVMLSRIRSQLELHQYQNELEEIINNKTREVENLQHVITISWAEFIESRDGTTGSHVRHTTLYFKAMLELLRTITLYEDIFSDEDIETLLRASSLHDIGKIGISDLVLKKPGSLTFEEFEYMKLHAKIGAEMIQKIIDNTRIEKFLLYAHDMALYHHERWDGTGYPCGLNGNEIPLYVQVLTMADVFDALTAVRPYKRAFTFTEAIEIMFKDRGNFYSPELFDIFMEHKEILLRILELKDSENNI